MEKKKLFCVIASSGGAYEAECVYSIWETKEYAEKEVKKLIECNISAGCNGGEFYVKDVELNKSYEEWIG